MKRNATKRRQTEIEAESERIRAEREEAERAAETRARKNAVGAIAALSATAAILLGAIVFLSLRFSGAAFVERSGIETEIPADEARPAGFEDFATDGAEPPFGKYADFVFDVAGRTETASVLLLPQFAPESVEAFAQNAENKLFDGIALKKSGMGGAIEICGNPVGAKSAPGEYRSNGYEQNTLSNVAGAIGMRRANPDDPTGSVSIYILLVDAEKLNGKCAAFGKTLQKDLPALTRVATDLNKDKAVKLKKVTIRENQPEEEGQ